jgi:hypothetical protein
MEPESVSHVMVAGLLLCLAVAAATGSSPAYPLALLFLALAYHHETCLHRGDQPPRPGVTNIRRELPGDGEPGRDTRGEPSDPQLPSGFTPITFSNRLERRFATATGNPLVMGNGTIRGNLRMELHPEQQPGNTMDTVVCTLRLADRRGTPWECRQLMLPYLLTDPIEPGAVLPADGFTFCSDAPPSWQEALHHNCLIAGVRNLLDTRDMGELIINGTSFKIFFKQQRPVMDVAYLPSPSSFVVRISGLIHDVELQGDVSGSRILPPFCYALPTEELLFFTAHHHYYSYYEEWYAMEEGVGKRPPHFCGLRHRDIPQSLVSLSS